MDVVESITFTRQDVDEQGTLWVVSASHVPTEQKMREEWTQEEIDVIGERIAPYLDAQLAQQMSSPRKVFAFPEPEPEVKPEPEVEAEPEAAEPEAAESD
jgi:hypothetical protein